MKNLNILLTVAVAGICLLVADYAEARHRGAPHRRNPRRARRVICCTQGEPARIPIDPQDYSGMLKFNIGGEKLRFNSNTAQNLAVVANRTKREFTITSGYRSCSANLAAGGVSCSRHMFGQAADVRSRDQGMGPKAFAEFVNKNGFSGLIFYADTCRAPHIHVEWSGSGVDSECRARVARRDRSYGGSRRNR